MYRYDGETWIHEQKLIAEDASTYLLFGLSIGVRGGRVLIGAPFDDDNGSLAGAVYAYSAQPDACECPADCDGSGDRQVGIVDFLTLLSQWGQIGTACDLGLGPAGVGTDEFWEMVLFRWGPCPGG